MTLNELKTSIEDKSFKPTSSLILVSDDNFIPLQYLECINKDLGYELLYIDSLQELSSNDDIFMDEFEYNNDSIYVLIQDEVDFSDDILLNKNNIIVVANKVEKSSKKYYENLLIEIPKLEEWQIKDLVYSFGKGIETKYLDWLINNCSGNIHRLYNEMLKLRVFNEAERKTLFQEMMEDGAFDDLSANTIFNFTNAILKKDIKSLKIIFEEIDSIDVNDFGLLTILYNGFLNVFNIQLGVNPTAESLGMKPNQFNAIKYNCGHYSSGALIKILKFLTDIDRKIKVGEMPMNIMRDYLILSILSN